MQENFLSNQEDKVSKRPPLMSLHPYGTAETVTYKFFTQIILDVETELAQLNLEIFQLLVNRSLYNQLTKEIAWSIPALNHKHTDADSLVNRFK